MSCKSSARIADRWNIETLLYVFFLVKHDRFLSNLIYNQQQNFVSLYKPNSSSVLRKTELAGFELEKPNWLQMHLMVNKKLFS